MAGAKRPSLQNRTQLGASDFALSAGFGNTAAVSAVVGWDGAFKFKITASGTGQGASPTVTITLKEPFAQTPAVLTGRGSATNALTTAFLVDYVNSTAAKIVLIYNGTPTANDVYECSVVAYDTAG